MTEPDLYEQLLDERQDAVAILGAETSERLNRIRSQGMNFEPGILPQILIQSLIEVLIGDDRGKQLEIEERFQEKLRMLVDSAESQLAQAKLVQGVERAVQLVP